MGFFFTGIWGLLYLVALIIAGYVTFKGSEKSARRILHILIVNWLAIRCNVYFLDRDETVYVAIGVATFIALIVHGRSGASYVCALLFLAIVNVDFALRSELLSHLSAGIIWDALAFAVLLIMAGASNDFWRDRIAGLSDIPSDRLVPDYSGFVFRGYTTDDSVLVVEKTKGENK